MSTFDYEGGDGEEITCRFCMGAESGSVLLAPCACTGSVKYVHRMCLRAWISGRTSRTCGLCNTPFDPEMMRLVVSQERPGSAAAVDSSARAGVLRILGHFDAPLAAKAIAKELSLSKHDVNRELYAMKRTSQVSVSGTSPPMWWRLD